MEEEFEVNTLRYRYLFIILIVILLTGCGSTSDKKSGLLEQIVSQETTHSGDKYCERYVTRAMNMKFPLEEIPSFMVASSDGNYIVSATYHQRLYLFDVQSMERNTLFSCSKNEYFRGVCASEKSIYCLIQEKDQGNRLVVLGFDGTVEKDIRLALGEEADEILFEKILCDSEGYCYLQGEESIFVLDREGVLAGGVSLPSGNTIKDCTLGKSGSIYISGEQVGKNPLLYKLDKNSMSAKFVNTLLGSGKLYAGLEGELSFADNRYLYDYDVESGRETVVCDLMQNYIDPYSLSVVCGFRTEEFMLCTGNRFTTDSSDSFRCFSMRKMTEEEKAAAQQNRQTIRVYKTGQAFQLSKLILDFQTAYPEYELIVEESDAALEDAEGFTHVKLLGDECPDVIFIDSDNYEIYRDAGVLVDLAPYMERSVNLKQENFIEKILSPYRSEKAIYGLPLNFSIRTLVGSKKKIGGIRKKSASQSYEGCTIDGFLTFLKKNPKIKFQFDGDSMGLLRMCLMCNMDDYLDSETETCFFNGNEFKELVTRTKGLSFDTNYWDYDEWDELAKEEKVIAEVRIGTFLGIAQLAETYGDDILCFGYPSDDGELHTILEPFVTLGITNNSKNKEGAWTFLEFYFNYRGNSLIPALKWQFEEVYQDAKAYIDEEVKQKKKTEAYLERVLDLIEGGEVQTECSRQIWKIMSEELPAIYWKDRNISDVLDIIQSRTQIFLWESNY